MIQLRFAAAVLLVLVVGSILASGCTGNSGGQQPPASVMTIPTRRTVTPVPETPAPVITVTTVLPTRVVTPAWTPGSIIQDGTALLIQGDVEGLKYPTANYIDEIRFTVVKSPRADEVPLDTIYTQIVFTKSGMPYTVNYLPVSGDLNRDRVLDEGETILISIPLQPPNVIYANEKFTMAIKTPPYAQVLVTASAPPVLSNDPMILARA
jgi:hypothetical protein